MLRRHAVRLRVAAGGARAITPRRTRLAAMTLGAVLLVQVIAAAMLSPSIPNWAAHDFVLYRDAAARWLSSGEFYSGYQLAGPYPVVASEVLYPPVALALFVPFVYLPGALWILTPMFIIAWMVWRSRPSISGWVLILFLVTFPQVRPVSWAIDLVILGNPILWIAAFVALSSRWPAFGPFVLLKPAPAMIPFALLAVRSRQWWVGLAVLVVLSAALLPMWPDYVTVLLNARGTDFLYGLTGLPLVVLPVANRLAARLLLVEPSREDAG